MNPQQTRTTDSPMSGGTFVSVAGRQLWTGLKFLVVMTIALGVVYPLVVLGIGQFVAKDSANGSMIIDADGSVVGSSLIGQQFDGAEWFAGRPSAAGDGYDALSSGGSNLAADSPDLLALVEERRGEIAAANGVSPEQVPVDAVTASASGLDPHISPAYALLQVDRVAAARGLDPQAVRSLVEEHVEHPALGFLGTDRVNVLELNLALERLQP